MSIPIYVAIFNLNLDTVIVAFNDVINLIYTKYPNSQLYIEQYYFYNTMLNITTDIDNFLKKYPNGRRVIITSTTNSLILISNYLKTLELNIPIFSSYATSPIIKTLPNVLTYAPYDIFSTMSVFMIHKDYEMKQIKIICNTINSIATNSYIKQVKIQANLLGIELSIDVFEIGKSDYGIKPNTTILLIVFDSILNTYINQDFLDKIPNSCCIAMNDSNINVNDIFGNIPAFVILPYPLDYTSTTLLVYNSLTNKNAYPYYVFGFFDILYTLNFFTNINQELTITNYINSNPFINMPPAWIASQSTLDPTINGIAYGLFMCVFTKNSIVNNDEQIFNKFNIGGTNILPDSKSVFKTLGIVPYFQPKTFYGDENYYKFYDNLGKLVLTRFGSNITIDPENNSIKFNTAQVQENKFIIRFNSEGYFSYLEKIYNVFNNKSIVNLTMGKTPILKYLNK